MLFALILQTYEEITSDEYLDYMSQFIVGIGPWKDTIDPPGPTNYLEAPTDLVQRAHLLNLQACERSCALLFFELSCTLYWKIRRL